MSCKIDLKQSEIRHNKSFLTLIAANKKGEEIGSADASLLKTDTKFIWLHDLGVAPECRDKGIGSQIIEKLVEVGKKEKATLIYVYPATPTSEDSPIPQKKIENFYKKNGFLPCTAPKDVVTVTDEGLAKKGGVCLKL